MKLREIKNGQCIRFMSVTPGTGSTLYGINLVRAFESHFGFLEGPKTVEQFNLQNGVTFRHGLFDKKHVIDKAMIYSNGLLAEGAIPTDACFDFISNVVEWATEEAGLIIEPTPAHPILYNSTVHVEATLDLEKNIKGISAIGDLIAQKINGYGGNFRRFEMSGIHFQSGTTTTGPTPFKFERLAGVDMESNLYFSTSPLTTKDHLEIIQAIERAFTS